MKNYKLFGLFFIIISMSSCNITEHLMINTNQTGRLSYDMDFSKMMQMVGNTSEARKSKGKKKSFFDKDIDSTFSYATMFENKKDSIAKLPADEQLKIKQLEKFNSRIVSNKEKGIMILSFYTDFNTINELENVLSPIETAQALKSKNDTTGMNALGFEDNKAKTKFIFDGKIFKKIVTSIEKPQLEDTQEKDSLNLNQSMDMIYAQSNFKTVYQFPTAVKSVSLPNALYSADRKTVTIEFSLKEYLENPEKTGFDVVFD